MSAVYLATDVRHRRAVAIKVLLPDVAERIGNDRFIREIEIAAGLSHPHILPLFDSGNANGLPFYVTPFVEGEDLRQVLRRSEKLTVDHTLALLSQIGSALQYAHDQGVIHRDIKPENILLSGGIPVVADFGIAQAISLASDQRLTASGVSLGTPIYMSPEQAMSSHTVTPAADQYSLACVAFELLTGHPPFTGPNARSVALKHIQETPLQISDRVPEVPAALSGAIARALSKRPEERFGSVAEFVECSGGSDHDSRAE